MLHGKLGHHVVDVVHATSASAHSLGREVAMASGAVPVLEELGREGDVDVEVLSNALEEIAGHPEVVANSNALNGANLVLPLTGSDLGIGA